MNRPVAELPELSPTEGGNRLRNPSFEVGSDGWRTFTERALEGGGEVVRVADAVDGQRVLRLDSPPATAKWFEPTVGAVTVFAPLDGPQGTASIYARVVEGEARLTLSLVDTRVKKTFDLSPQWQRYTLVADLKLVEPYERLAVRVAGGGVVEIDAVELEATNVATPFDTPDRPELGIESDLDVALMHPGEVATLSVRAQLPQAGETPSSDAWTLQWRCVDHTGVLLHEEQAAVDGDTGAVVSTPWQAPDVRGWYQWQATLMRGATPVLSRRYQIGVVPTPPDVRHPMFAGTITFTDIVKNTTKAQRMGLSTVRLHGMLLLHRIWAFRDHPDAWPTDPWIDHIVDAGIEPYVYLIDHHAPLSNSIMSNPSLMEIYERFLAQMVQRYRGKMRAYMIWNEPEFKVEPEVYAFFHERITNVVKRHDPDVDIVGLSSVHARREWTTRTLAATGGEIGDIVSIHCYLNGQPPERLLKTRIDGLLGPEYAYLRDAGLASAPVWDTESGYYLDEDHRPRRQRVPDFYWKTPLEQAQYNVRQYLMSFALGLSQRNLFLLPSVNYGMWQRHSVFRADHLESARPSAVAIAAMGAALGAAQPTALYWTGREGLYAYAFRDGGTGRQVWVLWSAGEETKLNFNGEKPTRAWDMFARDFTPETAGGGWRVSISGSPTYLWFDEGTDVLGSLGPEFKPFGRQHARVAAAVQSNGDLPVKATMMIDAADAEFFRWRPGLVPAQPQGETRQVMRLDQQATPDPMDALAKFQIVLPNKDAGRYDIWAAVEPMFGTHRTKLQLRVDDRQSPVPRGLDQPMTYDITLDSGEQLTLAWEFLGSAVLEPGSNDILLLPTFGPAGPPDQGPARWQQTLDRLLLQLKPPPPAGAP